MLKERQKKERYLVPNEQSQIFLSDLFKIPLWPHQFKIAKSFENLLPENAFGSLGINVKEKDALGYDKSIDR